MAPGTKALTTRASRIIREYDAWRQPDFDPDGRVFGDPARSSKAIVKAVANEKRVARFFGQASLRLLR